MQKRQDNLNVLSDSNEATWSEFIFSIIYNTVHHCRKVLKKGIDEIGVRIEQFSAVTYGRGPLDFQIYYQQNVICVIEAKAQNLAAGVAQNLVQLEAVP